MLEDVVLKNFPKESGVYLFKANEEVVYVGSSKNLYYRMKEHKKAVTKGSNAERNAALYDYLQNNQFTIQFQLTDDYHQEEQKLIEKYNPKYNTLRAYTGLGAFKGREDEYSKEYYQKFKEERKQYRKEWYKENKEKVLKQAKEYRKKNNYKAQKKYNENHKEEINQWQKQHRSRKCLYNGKTLTFEALRHRLGREGVAHPSIEAEKYLIK